MKSITKQTSHGVSSKRSRSFAKKKKKKNNLSVADYMIRIRSAWLLAQLRVVSRVCKSGVDYVYLSYL
jgi:hypothetical protein